MKKVDFNSNQIIRNIFRIAMPMLVAELVNLLYSIVDRIYIGRIPGEGSAALSGVGLCFPVILIITGFSNMFGMGGSPLFAIELGRENKAKAKEILNTTFRLIVITAATITITGEIFAEDILRAFGSDAGAMKFSLPYLKIYLLGTLFSMLASGLTPFLTAKGFPTFSMISVVMGAVFNIVLDPIFIFLLDMGVQGAAIATVISQGMAALMALLFLNKRNEEIRIYFSKIRCQMKMLPYAGDIIGLGIGPFIMSCTNSLVQISCNNILMRYGGSTYISVMVIILSIRQILDTPIMAFTNGTSPMISYNYGAGRSNHVKKVIFIMVVITVIYTGISWAMIQINPEIFISIFTENQQIAEIAVPALHTYFFAFVFQALQYSGQSVFKALNMKKKTIFFSLFRKVILVVPLTWFLPSVMNMGTNGVFAAEPISNVVGGLACFITMLITVSKKLGSRNTSDK